MLMSYVAYLYPCRMSKLRNGPVTCRIYEMALSPYTSIRSMSHVEEMALSPFRLLGSMAIVLRQGGEDLSSMFESRDWICIN